jgi:hypothetical protein
MISSIAPWLHEELSSLDLGDARRNRRCARIVQRAVDNPTASVLAASEGTAEAKAAYRFLSNDAVTPPALRAALRGACVGRMREQSRVLVIQDTTTLDYGDHPATEGLGPTGGGDGSAGHGMLVHSALAVSDEGVPLGLVAQKTWARDPQAVGSRHERRQRPLQDKESFRWIETMQAVEAAIPAGVGILHITDREGDIFELFAAPRRADSHLLVRAARLERRVSGPQGHLYEAAQAAPVVGQFTMLLHRHPNRPAREATLQVQLCHLSLLPPTGGVHDPNLQPIAVSVVRVCELNAPSEDDAVEWVLLTDEPLESFDDARDCARNYSLRWLVERYHFTLKSGCRIEDSQLRQADRLERLLALYCIVAWRLLWMTYAARSDGDQPCTPTFSGVEWQALWAYHHQGQPLPSVAPTLREAVLGTAKLGGFLGRKGDGEPGVKVLWRGITRLHNIVIGIHLARSLYVGKA